MRRLILLLAAIQGGALWTATPDPFAFFQPGASLTPEEWRALERGDPVVSVLDTSGREIAVFSAAAVSSQVTLERATAWLRQLEQLRRGRHLMATGRFSTPPRLDDLEGLTLDDVDLEDIRTCRPGDCGVKLSASEIARLQRTMAASGPGWRDAVQAAFREIVLARVQAFSRGGHAALEAVSDRRKPQPPAPTFARVLGHSLFLHRNAPHVVQPLAVCAARPIPGGESVVYWAKERLGSKPVISATSVTVLRGDGVLQPEVFTVGVQIFATHYLDASLAVMAFVRDERVDRSFFVYVQRSDVDLLGGFWGGFARTAIEGRIRQDGPRILREVGIRLANGGPD